MVISALAFECVIVLLAFIHRRDRSTVPKPFPSTGCDFVTADTA